MPKGKVYLICDPLTDTFKIGVTKRDIGKRLKEIQTGNSAEVFVLKVFESQYPYQLEGMLHRHFFSKKALNEWFSLDVNDISGFESLCIKYEEIIGALPNDINI